MARSDYRHAMVDGKRVDLTETEIDACVAAEDATTEIYTLSLHDALPIYPCGEESNFKF